MNSEKVARCFLIIGMSLDQNEKKFIEKLTAVLKLVNASETDIKTISSAKKIDANFLKKAGNIFEKTEACSVCRNAFFTWRNSLDDETVLSFIDEWISWKTQRPDSNTAIPK